MHKTEVNMLSGSIMKGLVLIAIPIMVMNVFQSLFNIIDMTILKVYDTAGGYSVGAVGASSTLISLMTGLVIGTSAGTNVVVARYIGKNDKENVSRAVGTSIVFSLIGGFLLAVIGLCFADVFLTWMHCPAELFGAATLYFRLYFAGAPLLTLYSFMAAILRASGDSRRPMVYLTLGGVVKIAFSLLFVGLLGMTIVGVALSTIISWAVSAFLVGRALIKSGGTVKPDLKKLRIYPRQLKEILIIGIPTGLQQTLYSAANVVIAATVNTFGADATTGISIANQFDGVLYQVATAPALAVMPYVSQNVGAGNIKRAKASVWKSVALTVMLGATFGALSAIFSGQLSSIMSDNPAVIAYSRQKMVIISSTYFICGINEIAGAALKGFGRPMLPMISSMLFTCAIRFPWVYLVFPLCPNFTFLYLIWPIGWSLSILFLTPFLVATIRAHAKAVQPTEQAE